MKNLSMRSCKNFLDKKLKPDTILLVSGCSFALAGNMNNNLDLSIPGITNMRYS